MELPVNWRKPFPELGPRRAILYALIAAASFHLAFTIIQCSFFIFIFSFCMFSLTRLTTARQAIYLGIALGMAMYAPQLFFFFSILGSAAIVLWLILSLWLVLFLLLGRAWALRFPAITTIIMIPILWTGLEYFRSELYYLRFSWLIPGYALSFISSAMPFRYLGVYGMGFFLMCASGLVQILPRKFAIASGSIIFGALAIVALKSPVVPHSNQGPLVVGVQLEAEALRTIVKRLDDALAAHPDGDLFVLSEYTFRDGVPAEIKEWCRGNKRYLILGSGDHLANHKYSNTAFVIDPKGEIVFRQGKSVPVQFFADGYPATEQHVWPSPWGKIGICICYDLSYSRVTDRLIRSGAQLLVVPTKDMISWGRWEHFLHTRVAPVRAAEYGVPIFRLTSSGISQAVGRNGDVIIKAPYPGQGEIIAARMTMPDRGNIPWDRIPANIFVGISGTWGIASLIFYWRRKGKSQG